LTEEHETCRVVRCMVITGLQKILKLVSLHLDTQADTLLHVQTQYYVRFEVSTAVYMKYAVFWDMAPCRSGVNRRSSETSVHTKSIRRHITEGGILHL
jgi:hypothetical protein